jgi:hypothetical protein
VKRVEQGIEILTKTTTGQRNGDGTFEAETVFGLMNEKLVEMAKTMKQFE